MDPRIEDFMNLRGEGKALYHQIFNYVKLLLGGNYHDAEDVMGDFQVKVWTKGASYYDSSRELNNFLFAIARNVCVDFQRRNKRYSRTLRLSEVASEDGDNESTARDEKLVYLVDESYSPPSDLLSLKENKDKMRCCVNKLPFKQRQVVCMVHYGGLNYSEAAELLDVPVGTVKSRLHWGLRNLEEIFVRDNSKSAA